MRIKEIRDPYLHRERLVEHLGEDLRGFVEILEEHHMLTGEFGLDVYLTESRLHNILNELRKGKKHKGNEPPAEEPEKTSVDVPFMYPKGIEVPDQPADPEFDPLAHIEYGLDAEAEEDLEKISDPRKTCIITLKKDTNEKLKHMGAVTYNLPAGYTCPGAGACRQWVHKHRKKFGHGSSLKTMDDAQFYCYAARLEHVRKAYQAMGWRNFDLLRNATKEEMVQILMRSINHFEREHGPIRVLRLSEGGDIFSQDFFDAWIDVANMRPDILFYGYTTSANFWEPNINRMPKNLRLTASLGGKYDDIVHEHGLRSAVIVYSVDHAKKLGLPIDIDDSFAAFGEGNFALLLHGQAIAGDTSVEMNRQIKKNNEYKDKRLKKAKEYWTPKQIDRHRKKFVS